MRQISAILVALLVWPVCARSGVGAARAEPDPGPVSMAQSAALFVGIRDFQDASLTQVKYGVDDAIDLADAVAGRLVEPKRIILALSGEPQKEESRKRLQALKADGAGIRGADKTDIILFLESQAAAVGPKGVLLVGFATHGINDEGTQYLLARNSLLRHRDTALSEVKIRDIINSLQVARSLIFIDACRQRLRSDTRAGEADTRSAAALMSALGNVSGQVVFSAAVAGGYAYDDDVRQNGVFTAAVLDALHCRAPVNDQGFVTVDSMAKYVEEKVLSWVRKHKDRNAKRATQLYSEGRSNAMPLSVCSATGMVPATPPPSR